LFVRGDGTALTPARVTAAAKDPAEVRVVLRPGLTLRGQVKTKGGGSLDNLEVLASPAPRARGEGTPVRPDGRFTLHGLAPGKLFVCLYRSGEMQPGSVMSVNLREGQEADGVTLTAEPECAGLEVHFRRADGKPLPRPFEAYLFTAHDRVPAWISARDGVGRTREPLPAGTYHLWIDAASYSSEKSLDMVPGHIERNLVVRPGDKPQRVDVVLPAGGGIGGRVVLADGKSPARGCRVAVHVGGATSRGSEYPPYPWLYGREPVASYAETRVAPDGSFLLFGLTPGTYAVGVHVGDGPAAVVSGRVEVRAGALSTVGRLQLP
jgi:hypothetical protein